MILESLTDKLLLELFEFISTIDLLRAFRGLNSRFDTLLFTHFRAYRLDFRSVSKHEFEIVCDEHLPRIENRVISLRLSNDDETPQQIELFFLRGIALRQWTQLQALTMCHVYRKETVKRMVSEFDYFPNLTHLSLIRCVGCEEEDFLWFVDKIWSLPKLSHCHLDLDFETESSFPAPTVMSSSLEYLSITHFQDGFNELALLFEHTPRLRYFAAVVNLRFQDIPFKSAVSSITALNLYLFETEQNSIANILQNVPNVRRLTVMIDGMLVDGHQWEQMIREHLPHLKVFRLKMQCRIRENDQGEDQVDQLLNSFRSQFWLEEHRWFVRCDWNLSDTASVISLYTLPYSFAGFVVEYLLLSKSNSPDDDGSRSYHQVRTLTYGNLSAEELLLPHIQFLNLRHLSVELPVNDQFRSIVPNLDRLTSLNVSLSNDDNTHSHLQVLLNQATSLYSLKVDFCSTLEFPLAHNTSRSIRRLDLQENNQWFNDEQCAALIRSPLGIQCEVLAINVEKCSNVIELVDKMVNLRALKIACKDDISEFDETDEFMIWLQRCLPSTYSIARDTLEFHHIRLWIR